MIHYRNTVRGSGIDARTIKRTALRLLEEREARIERLRQEIQEGLDSGPVTPLDMEEVKRLARKRLPGRAPSPS